MRYLLKIVSVFHIILKYILQSRTQDEAKKIIEYVRRNILEDLYQFYFRILKKFAINAWNKINI